MNRDNLFLFIYFATRGLLTASAPSLHLLTALILICSVNMQFWVSMAPWSSLQRSSKMHEKLHDGRLCHQVHSWHWPFHKVLNGLTNNQDETLQPFTN